MHLNNYALKTKGIALNNSCYFTAGAPVYISQKVPAILLKIDALFFFLLVIISRFQVPLADPKFETYKKFKLINHWMLKY